jgi:hypothetical protein
MPDLARSIQIWPHMIPKLGLFDQATIERVTTAYLAVEQHSEGLLLLGYASSTQSVRRLVICRDSWRDAQSPTTTHC